MTDSIVLAIGFFVLVLYIGLGIFTYAMTRSLERGMAAGFEKILKERHDD